MKQQNVYIISISGEKILCNEPFLKYSKLFSDLLEKDENEEDMVISVSQESYIINSCMNFCECYDNDQFDVPEKPLVSSNIYDILPKWCGDLLNIPNEEIFKLMNAANFLIIDMLINATCVKIATLLKDKNCEEIRAIFNIEDDFTEEEKKEFIKNNSWVNE